MEKKKAIQTKREAAPVLEAQERLNKSELILGEQFAEAIECLTRTSRHHQTNPDA